MWKKIAIIEDIHPDFTDIRDVLSQINQFMEEGRQKADARINRNAKWEASVCAHGNPESDDTHCCAHPDSENVSRGFCPGCAEDAEQ